MDLPEASQAVVTTPFAFTLELNDPLTAVEATADVTLTPSVGMAFSYPMGIKPGAESAQLAASAHNRLPQTGVLPGDATFTLTLDESEQAITVAADGSNASLADLAADVQAALDAQFGPGVLTAEVADSPDGATGYYLELTAASGTAITLSETNDVARDNLGLTVLEDTDTDGVFRAREAFNTPATGRVDGGALHFQVGFEDGQLVPVVVGDGKDASGAADPLDTFADNTGMDDLAADLGRSLADALTAAGLDSGLVTVSHDGNRLVLSLAEGHAIIAADTEVAADGVLAADAEFTLSLGSAGASPSQFDITVAADDAEDNESRGAPGQERERVRAWERDSARNQTLALRLSGSHALTLSRSPRPPCRSSRSAEPSSPNSPPR